MSSVMKLTIKKMKELIDIANMSEDEYRDYHKESFGEMYERFNIKYSPPMDTYSHRLGEIHGTLEVLVDLLEGETE